MRTYDHDGIDGYLAEMQERHERKRAAAAAKLEDDTAYFGEHVVLPLNEVCRLDALLNLLAFAETDAEVLAHAKSLQSILSSAALSAADKIASEG